ncbi:50S ribosomal protein L1 [bacterium]|nr:MAG: 50S ribosomal protein L1 [bacterium]
MSRHGKKYEAAREKIDRNKRYTLKEAVELVKECSFAEFDETVEVAIRLGVDPKHAEQMVRGTVVLPNGTGKSVRVAVFAEGEDADAARDAGADVVGGDDLVENVQEGFLDFDVAIAHPSMMGKVGKLGKMLGPRGLMPNPKSGTVTPNVAQAVKEAKAGKIEYRVDKGGVIHAYIGKVSFDAESLEDNCLTLISSIQKAKPASVKGAYFRSITVSSTMGPGVRIDLSGILQQSS